MAAGDCDKAETLMSPDSGLLKDDEKGDCFKQYQGCMTGGYFWLGQAKIDSSVAREYEMLGRTWTEVTLVGEFERNGLCRSVPTHVNPYGLLPEVETTNQIRVSVEKLNGQWYVAGAR